MNEIKLEIEEPFRLNEVREHHTFDIGFPQEVIQAIATGTMDRWVGNSEGMIQFMGSGLDRYENTTLISGGDGTTTYMKVSATYTATFATVVTNVYLYGSKTSRLSSDLYSTKDIDPDQSLSAGQAYTINWILHADI